MRRNMAVGLVAILTTFAFALTVQGAQEVCPEAGKVTSQVDGDLDDIVLDAGTLVCIKAGNDLVNVTADGELTLAELIDNGHNVSHYTILEEPSDTTTTTTAEPTTTGPEDTTTTTEPTTTTTTPGSSSTTTGPATTTRPGDTTTSAQPATTTTAGPTGADPAVAELPYTGPAGVVGLILAASSLVGLGISLVRRRTA